MEARKLLAKEVRACARGLVDRKINAVSAALFDDRQPSLRQTAKDHRLPPSTLHDLVGRVSARMKTRLRR